MHSVSPPPCGPVLSFPVSVVLAALGERFKLVFPNFMLRILFCHLPSLTVTLVINIIYIFHKKNGIVDISSAQYDSEGRLVNWPQGFFSGD